MPISEKASIPSFAVDSLLHICGACTHVRSKTTQSRAMLRHSLHPGVSKKSGCRKQEKDVSAEASQQTNAAVPGGEIWFFRQNLASEKNCPQHAGKPVDRASHSHTRRHRDMGRMLKKESRPTFLLIVARSGCQAEDPS